MPKKALVTGVAGFIGSHMAERLLSLGYTVFGIDNESTGSRKNVPEKVTYVKGDITNINDLKPIFMERLDFVFHIAGLASTILSFSDPQNDVITNVVGTQNIIACCLEYTVSRVLYASSMTCYGHPKHLPVTEDEPPIPISYYGITKYAAERYLLATGLRNDIDFEFHPTAFRMFNVYGERQRLDNPYQGVLGFFIGNVLRGEPIIIHSDGEQTRDFVYIHDVVNAWVESIEKKETFGQIINIGCGESISINRLVDSVLEASGRNRDSYYIQYGKERPGDQRHMVADISKAKRVLGWEPKMNLVEGLRKTINWAKREIVQ